MIMLIMILAVISQYMQVLFYEVMSMMAVCVSHSPKFLNVAIVDRYSFYFQTDSMKSQAYYIALYIYHTKFVQANGRTQTSIAS